MPDDDIWTITEHAADLFRRGLNLLEDELQDDLMNAEQDRNIAAHKLATEELLLLLELCDRLDCWLPQTVTYDINEPTSSTYAAGFLPDVSSAQSPAVNTPVTIPAA